MHHETSIEIAASPELIWSTLSDVERWPDWTRSVT
jgi:carbon monoxide dehydrogenase subunit G